MKAVRWVLGRIILLIEVLTTPKGVVREEAEQVKLKIKWSTRIIRDGEDVEREIRRRILEKE